MYNFPVFYCISCVILCLLITQRAECSDQNLGLQSVPWICKMQCLQNINVTETGIFCNSDPGRNINGRCCVTTTGVSAILGIDLQQCSVTEEIFSTGIENMTDLMYISLQGNNITAITSEDFHRNTNIKYLSLPPGLNCPGRPDLWNNTSNSTDHPTICQGELDACLKQIVPCPEKSHCVSAGIDRTECLCNEGYHGYKCMNQGTFPIMAFVLGIAIPTVVISILLYLTQRRYVKTSNKIK